MAADPRWIRGHPRVEGRGANVSAGGCPGTGADLVAGRVEDGVEHPSEGEHDDHDEGGNAGDQQAVLNGGRTALVEAGATGIDQDARVVEHGRGSSVYPPGADPGDVSSVDHAVRRWIRRSRGP